MDNKELQEFIAWLPNNIEDFKDKTPEEVADILRTTEITIRRYIDEEKFATTYAGNKYLILGKSLNEFVSKGGSY